MRRGISCPQWCPGADYANSINSMTYAKVGHSLFPHDDYAFWRECPTINHHLFSMVVLALI